MNEQIRALQAHVPQHPPPNCQPTSLGLDVVHYCLELGRRVNGELYCQLPDGSPIDERGYRAT
jgi:hypothetical protein